jgi:hypothetical protein
MIAKLRLLVAWSLSVLMFLALSLTVLVSVGILASAIFRQVAPYGMLVGAGAFYLFCAHLFFSLAHLAEPTVYAGRLKFIARFFRSKFTLAVLCLVYVVGFVYLRKAFLAPKGSPMTLKSEPVASSQRQRA